jgi:FMN reductase [NAD(P)H]
VVVHPEYYHELDDQQLLAAYDKKYKNVRLTVTQERLKTILDVCRAVHGEEYAEKCAERIRTKGFVNRAQHYFGLHYRADLMPKGNDQYLKIMEESGFNWFKEYSPTVPPAPTK